jgi:hypothetical protein
MSGFSRVTASCTGTRSKSGRLGRGGSGLCWPSGGGWPTLRGWIRWRSFRSQRCWISLMARLPTTAPDRGMPGVVDDGEHVDLSAHEGVEHAEGKAPDRSPVDV